MTAVRRDHWLILGAAIACVSFAAILARLAQAEGVPSLVLSFYRLLFATAMLLPLAVREARRQRIRVPARDLGLLAGVGFLLAAHFATWITSLEYTSVASSAVLVATESLWVPIGAAFLLRERVGRRIWMGVAVAFLGSLLLSAGDKDEVRFGGRALLGDGLALAGALAASLYFLAGRRFRQTYPIFTYATIVYGFGALFLLAMTAFRGLPLAPYSPRAFAILLAFAFFPMVLGHTLINYLLKWVPPHYISTSILGEPVVSTILAYYVLHEDLLPLVLLGCVVILVGILIAATQREPGNGSASPAPGAREG